MELGLDVQLTGTKDFNGFLLEKPLSLDTRITVLTGRNGSGKTRFIESVSNRSTQISINGSVLDNTSISYIKQAALNPNLGNVYNHSNTQNRLIAALNFYDSVKHDFDLPFDRSKAQAHDRRNEGSTLNYEQLYNLCSSISKKMDKLASELSHDDIILNYEEPSNNILGVQNISTIFNQYIQRQHLNKYNKWLNTVENEDVKFFSDVEFVEKFGDKPWVVINKILEETFEGKFKFNVPDEESKSYSFQANLINTADGKDAVMSVQHLSSGEKTLLWLALTLFNTQYYEVEYTKAPKVLLIDEPDAFLHPKMVVKMYQALESFSKSFDSI
ncbi:ATP-binding protein, partial [Vibrio parahaemolyticus]|nr:ATP-binding protein [Vibrio parahaemolyticus]